MLKRIRRTLTTHGYGVHSPFAYRFIREVIGETLPYVEYGKLPAAADRLQYRVAAFLQPSSVSEIGGASAKAARMACPHNGRPPRWSLLPSLPLTVATADADAAAMAAATDGGSLICTGLSRRQLKALLPLLAGSVTFSGPSGEGYTLIAIPHTPAQHYSVNMR